MADTPKTDTIQIVFPIFDGMDLLDVAGAYSLFNTADGLKPILASVDGCSVTTWQGVAVEAQTDLGSVTAAQVCFVPGGSGASFNSQIDHNKPVAQWLATYAPKMRLVCSVCTGAFILAAAGLLEGYTVTTHWMFHAQITMFPDVRLASGFPRYWIDGNRVTGGGISSGMDEALAIIAILRGPDIAMQAQLVNQYAPNPPYNSGTPDVAPPQVMGAFFANDPNPGADMRAAVDACLDNW